MRKTAPISGSRMEWKWKQGEGEPGWESQKETKESPWQILTFNIYFLCFLSLFFVFSYFLPLLLYREQKKEINENRKISRNSGASTTSNIFLSLSFCFLYRNIVLERKWNETSFSFACKKRKLTSSLFELYISCFHGCLGGKFLILFAFTFASSSSLVNRLPQFILIGRNTNNLEIGNLSRSTNKKTLQITQFGQCWTLKEEIWKIYNFLKILLKL